MAFSKQDPEYSVVVPIFEEAGNIIPLDKEIKSVLSKLSNNYEIIYVNDGSRDNSLEELKSLKNVIIINLNRNYGQTTAFDAGFKAAKGNIIISMDGDGQDDPHEIPKLLKKLKEENLEVVAGWRKNRKDKGGIRILTKIGKRLRNFFLNDPIHDSGCALRVYKKEAIKSLDIGGEMHRYIVALLKWKGFKIGEVEVNHRPRLHGKTKYGYDKAIRGFIDLVYIWFINKYSQRPLHMFGYLSLFTFFMSIISEFLAVYDKIANGLSLNRNVWFFVGFFMILASVIFFSFGIVIDLLIKIHLNNSSFEKRYYIRDVVRN